MNIGPYLFYLREKPAFYLWRPEFGKSSYYYVFKFQAAFFWLGIYKWLSKQKKIFRVNEGKMSGDVK